MNGRFMGLLSGFCAVVLFLLFITGNRQGVISADNGTVKKETPVIVIDAGHAGLVLSQPPGIGALCRITAGKCIQNTTG